MLIKQGLLSTLSSGDPSIVRLETEIQTMETHLGAAQSEWCSVLKTLRIHQMPIVGEHRTLQAQTPDLEYNLCYCKFVMT